MFPFWTSICLHIAVLKGDRHMKEPQNFHREMIFQHSENKRGQQQNQNKPRSDSWSQSSSNLDLQNRWRTIHFCVGHFNHWSEPTSSKASETSSIYNGWECQCLTTESPTTERSSKEKCLGNSLNEHCTILKLHHAIVELKEPVLVSTTTCAGIQCQSAKSNAMCCKRTHREKPTKNSNTTWCNILVKSKSLSSLARNLIHTLDILQLDPLMQLHFHPANEKESPSLPSDKATPSVWDWAKKRTTIKMQHTTSCDQSINDKRDSPTQKVAMDFADVCAADVHQKHCWDQQKIFFHWLPMHWP